MFVLAGVDRFVAAPTTHAEIVELVLGSQDEDKEVNKGPCGIPTTMEVRNIVHLRRNKVE